MSYLCVCSASSVSSAMSDVSTEVSSAPQTDDSDWEEESRAKKQSPVKRTTRKTRPPPRINSPSLDGPSTSRTLTKRRAKPPPNRAARARRRAKVRNSGSGGNRGPVGGEEMISARLCVNRTDHYLFNQTIIFLTLFIILVLSPAMYCHLHIHSCIIDYII